MSRLARSLRTLVFRSGPQSGRIRSWGLAALALTVAWLGARENLAGDGEFRVTLSQEAAEDAITGRLFVFVSPVSADEAQPGRPRPELRFGPDWFRPQPFFARDVAEWNPGATQVVDGSADCFPDVPANLEAGTYLIQALLDHDIYFPNAGQGPGNVYSRTSILTVGADGTFEGNELVLDQIVAASPLPETEWVRPIEYRSELLSEFFGREVMDRAMVVLPAGYGDHPDRRYPVMYEVSGFGGTLPSMARRYLREPPAAGEGEIEMIRVLLSGECKWGHHVYADSVTNGPRGRVLIEELIPRIDREFRTVADARARFVGGHSSGGWSSLWLQVRYPDTFGGVWSTSPDPVDFRDFQQTNLYATPPESVYFEPDGSKKPLARSGDRVLLWYADFAAMDDCIGRGGQLRSFEAAFSPLDADGQPARAWDRRTGQVRLEVTEAWKPYDIHLRLKENWDELGPKLQGKIHVAMGTLDTFYLEGATELLKQTLEELGSDARITMVEGADHGNVLTAALRMEFRRQMAEAYLRHFDPEGRPR